MKIALGTFLYACVETRFGRNVPAGVLVALRHYDRRLRSTAEPLAVPFFPQAQVATGEEIELELTLDPGLRARLDAEAARQAVSIRRLVGHAVCVYLVDTERKQRYERNASPAALAL